jgi:hypothetical protein
MLRNWRSIIERASIIAQLDRQGQVKSVDVETCSHSVRIAASAACALHRSPIAVTAGLRQGKWRLQRPALADIVKSFVGGIGVPAA